jgi:TolA-binding protein
LLFVVCCLSFSSSGWTEPALLLEARRALDEAIPQVAIQKLRTFLAGPEIAEDERRAATLVLGEALLAAGQHDAAVAVLSNLTAAGNSEAQLLQAHVLVGAGRWSEALPVYRAVGKIPSSPAAAQLGEAECLQALGRSAEAVKVLEPFVSAHPENIVARLRLANLQVEAGELKKVRTTLAEARPTATLDRRWKQYVEARLLLAEGRPSVASGVFEELLRDPQELSDSLLAAAALGSAEARILLKGYGEADAPLENFIGHYSESAYLELVFRRLDQIYARQKSASESELEKWGRKGQVRRAALARFYLARLQIREKKYDKAAATLANFSSTYPNHALQPYVRLMEADLAVERRNFPAAASALEAAMRKARDEEQRAEIELRIALVHYQQREFLLAANFFHSAVERASSLREIGTFDAALAALGQRNYDRFLEDYRELTTRFPASALRGDLILEQGLTLARAGDARAAETLQLFLLHFPSHLRLSEARLALAELAHAGGENAAAANYLRVVNQAPASSVTADYADYLAIFLEDAKTARQDEDVIIPAESFLRKHVGSPLVPEVRMKLGQLYFGRDDFANAETQFATLAREAPQSPYAETALYLAGESAMRQINPGAVDRALGLFDQVVQRGGALKLHARQQQAIVQGRLGKEAEAVTLYDVILAAQPPAEPELRFAALCGKGDNLLVLGRKEPAQSTAALAVFDQLAALPEVSPPWRNQALYKKGKALEQLGKTPEAQAAYYDVLDKSAGADREYFWYYKAGFDAARIFEQQSQWKSAIGIYEKMARVEGPRSAEAAGRVRQLRLEKFIWE